MKEGSGVTDMSVHCQLSLARLPHSVSSKSQPQPAQFAVPSGYAEAA